MHSTALLRGTRWNIAIPFGVKKTRMVAGGVTQWRINLNVDMYNSLDRIPLCDGQTDRHLATA